MSYLIASLGALVSIALLTRWLIHHFYRAPRIIEQKTPSTLGLPYRETWIPGANDTRLFAWFIPTGDQPAPTVLIMHGWGSNAEMMLPFAQLLHEAGYAVLLLDARNHGRSDGDSFSSMPRFAEDLEHGLDWVMQQPLTDPRRCFLLGHSVGAGAALLLASRRQDVAGVISIAAFAHPGLLMRRQLSAHHVPYRPLGWLVLRYIEWVIGYRFDDIAPCNTIRRIICPVLLAHGEADRTVTPEDARTIYANRPGEQVELLLLPDADHESPQAIATHGDALIQFLERIKTTGAATTTPQVP